MKLIKYRFGEVKSQTRSTYKVFQNDRKTVMRELGAGKSFTARQFLNKTERDREESLDRGLQKSHSQPVLKVAPKSTPGLTTALQKVASQG
jgi:hypothetical protein